MENHRSNRSPHHQTCRIVAAAGALAMAAALLATSAGAAGASVGRAIAAEGLRWNEMSAKAPGVLIAPLSGDWKEGAWSGFIKFPPGSKSGLHTHSSDMKIVVVSGTFLYGATEAEAQPYGAGSFIHIVAGAPHVNQQPEGCLLYVEQTGRFDNRAQ